MKQVIYDPLDVFSKPMGTINDGIMRYDVKKYQNYKIPIFFEITKTRGIENQ